MTVSNDTRGWILTGLSAIACMFGASLICIDLILRRLPGQRNFKIEESNAFLSSSLSLSFGVMVSIDHIFGQPATDVSSVVFCIVQDAPLCKTLVT
jgi:hypothetical protein